MARNRLSSTDTTAPGKATPDVLVYQRGGRGIPTKSIGVLRGRASVANRIERTGNSGMPAPKGFPALPAE